MTTPVAHRYLSGLLVAASLLIPMVASREGAIEEILDKLEAYATGSSPSSGLTPGQVSEALDEWKSLPGELKHEARSIPLVRLAVDFVIHPMEVASLQIDEHPAQAGRFLERSEKAYKMFRDAYVNHQTFKDHDMVRASKYFKVLTVASGQMGREHLSSEDFVAAKREYEVWLAKLDEITMYEDVYAMVDQLKMIFNYFNDPFLRALSKGVFPHVTKRSDVDQLLNLFYETLRANENIVLQDGKWLMYV